MSDARDVTVRSAVAMSAGTLASRATGLVRVSATLAALGVTAFSDAYNTANTTPNIVYELILGGTLTSVFVPLLVDQAKERRQAGQFEATNRFLTLTVVLLALVAVVGAIAAPWIMRLYLHDIRDPGLRAQEVRPAGPQSMTSTASDCARRSSSYAPFARPMRPRRSC